MEAKNQYCRWSKVSVDNRFLDPELLFSFYEVLFTLSGNITKVTNISVLKIPMQLMNFLCLPLKSVWYAMSAHNLRYMFLEETANSSCYIRIILTPIFRDLTKEEKMLPQKISHWPHWHLITGGLWPRWSPDFSLCYFYLWLTLRQFM